MKERVLFYYFTFDNAVVDLFITVRPEIEWVQFNYRV